MTYTNFQVGEKFPLPIQTAGDGGLFQYDRNGAMFLLKLSQTDIIAVEAFRTGKMEVALFAEDDLLFFLYQIDGIFKDGWGDCPCHLSMLTKEQMPDFSKEQDPALHLYLVDSRLDVLLAMRSVPMEPAFAATLKSLLQKQNTGLTRAACQEKVQKIWQSYTPAQMREKAVAIQELPFFIPAPIEKDPGENANEQIH